MDHCLVFFPSKHGDSEQEISFLHWRMRLGTSVTEYHDYPRPMASEHRERTSATARLAPPSALSHTTVFPCIGGAWSVNLFI